MTQGYINKDKPGTPAVAAAAPVVVNNRRPTGRPARPAPASLPTTAPTTPVTPKRRGGGRR